VEPSYCLISWGLIVSRHGGSQDKVRFQPVGIVTGREGNSNYTISLPNDVLKYSRVEIEEDYGKGNYSTEVCGKGEIEERP
jgi:hypothetical protein